MGEVLENGVYLPDEGERNAYNGLKGNWNTLDSIAGKVSGYDGHISDTDIHVTAADKQTWNGKADASHVHNANDVTTGVFDAARIPNLDASKITSGTIDIARLPKGALERLVKVADQTARYALTTDDVQLGDTVQQLDTGIMYVVTDVTKLDSADGYTEFTAGAASSVPWTGVTGKPADYTPASHSHGNITNDGKVGTTANVPLITGTDGVVQAGSFGTSANTFCEGNDSRLSDARTPVAHTHTKADVTDLFNSANTWTSWQTLENTNANSLLQLRRADIKIGDAIPSVQKEIGSIGFAGSDNINLGLIATRDESNGHTRLIFAARQRYDSNGNRANNGNSYEARINLGIDESHKYYLSPNTNGDIDLGTSTNKWKSLNGINPGALSLPDSASFVDISSSITNLDGTDNFYTSSVNGWISVCVGNNSPSLSMYCDRNNSWGASFAPTNTNTIFGILPLVAGNRVRIRTVCGALIYARFYPCLGNV